MARRNLSDDICERISEALLALDSKKPDEKRLLDQLYGVQGFVKAKMSDFADVADIAERYGFIRNPKVFARPTSESSGQDTPEDKQ